MFEYVLYKDNTTENRVFLQFFLARGEKVMKTSKIVNNIDGSGDCFRSSNFDVKDVSPYTVCQSMSSLLYPKVGHTLARVRQICLYLKFGTN